MCPADSRNGNAALGFAQHSHDLRLGKSGLLHRNLLGSRYEKILRLSPANFGEDYQVADALVVAMVVVVIDEGGDGCFEFALEEVVFQQDAVLQGLVPSFDLSLCLK